MSARHCAEWYRVPRRSSDGEIRRSIHTSSGAKSATPSRRDITMLPWPWAKVEWRAVCAERCTYGSGRRSASALLTPLKVRGQWMYLYRAIDSVGDTVEFWFSEHRDLPAARRFLRRALQRHGRPDRIVIDGSQTNREAILSCDAENRLQDRSRRALKPNRIRKSQYLNNRIEQDHRRIERRGRPMLGFKSFSSAAITLAGIEMVHMMRKRQGRFAFNPAPTLQDQFEAIAA
ncbi:integrase (plasmid) [Aminobacter sp. Y103A]|nr:integrase [Aminobacter sp. SS-2016]